MKREANAMNCEGRGGVRGQEEEAESNPLRPVMRKSRLPRILVQFTNPSMLLESTVWNRLPDPVPSQAANKKKRLSEGWGSEG